MKYKPVKIKDKDGNFLYWGHPNFEQRFLQRIKKTNNCWIWLGEKNKNGYGIVNQKRKQILAHRYMWFLLSGRWSKDYICHSCDNPPCVKPAHLFEGTAKENMQDVSKKGRLNHGHKFTIDSMTKRGYKLIPKMEAKI